MLLHLWLAVLSAALIGLAAVTLWTAKKARAHRMATDRRLDDLGSELYAKAAALDRRCDDLRAAVDRLGALASRLRLLELERELSRLAAAGSLEAGARTQLEEAVAALRADLGSADGDS